MPTGVSDELASQLAARLQPTFGYYRQPNGWITISPITRLERMKYTEQGWQYLEKYGAFDMTTYTVNHPFEGLFMFGGAGEMPVKQVIETGLYMDPPLVPRCRQHLTQYHRSHAQSCWQGATRVEFPQLATVALGVLGPFPCEFCDRKLPTKQARDQHQGVAHATPKNNIQLGKTIGDAMADALGNMRAPVAAPSDTTVLLERIASLEAEKAANQKKRDTFKANMANGRQMAREKAVPA